MQKQSLLKAAKQTSFSILIVGVIITILLPVYFITIISFMSNREAYSFPLPLFPSLESKFQMKKGEKGYLISIYDKQLAEYETILHTANLKKIINYMRLQLNIKTSEAFLEKQIAQLQTNETVTFRLRKKLLANYQTFVRITRDAVPALYRSIKIALVTILISLSIGGMAGFGFARYVFKGKNSFKIGILFVRMFPAISIAMPMVLILTSLGLFDQPLGLSLVYSLGSIALTIWITASIFSGIPVELEEAAQLFGASKIGAFFTITLPLALPGLAACSMYAFLGAWNETVTAIILTQENPTFAVVVYQSLVGATGQINLATAGGIAMALPAVLFTLIIKKYINQMWGGMSI